MAGRMAEIVAVKHHHHNHASTSAERTEIYVEESNNNNINNQKPVEEKAEDGEIVSVKVSVLPQSLAPVGEKHRTKGTVQSFSCVDGRR